MEYLERGSLDSLLKHLDGPPPWPLALRFAHHVALGLNFLHGLTPQMLHLDLKPSNVLLDSSLNAKVTDFGLARILSSTSLSKKGEGGTTSYMPPEAFDVFYKPKPASDVYSYAILLCSIIKGEQPYPNAISSVVKLRIPQGDRPDLDELPFSEAKGLEKLIVLIKKCWDKDPNKRPIISVCMEETERLLQPLECEIINAVHEVLTSLSHQKPALPACQEFPCEALQNRTTPPPVITPTPASDIPSETGNHNGGDGEVMKPLPISVLPAQNSEDPKLTNIKPDLLQKYKMDGNPCGICLIINNEEYLPGSHMDNRTGSSMDCRKLTKRFMSFNFIVEVQSNLKHKEIIQELSALSKKDHSKYDCCIVVILSHGSMIGHHLPVVHGVDGPAVVVEDITSYLNGAHCPSLQGKPKLFFIQACVGDKMDTGFELSPEGTIPFHGGVNEETDGDPTPSSSDSLSVSDELHARTRLPIPSDILVSYSTYPGYVSWRNTKTGSLYVETLDLILKKHAATHDLGNMLTMVNNKVAQISVKSIYKQIPGSFSSLRKVLYFQSFPQVHS